MAPLADLVGTQCVETIETHELDSGEILQSFPVAYRSWGALNAAKDNVIIVCHALSGSADVQDWWGPMFGSGRPFDTSIFFIFCANVLGYPRLMLGTHMI